METIDKVLNYVLDYINSVPASSWYALGTFLAGSGIVVGIVAWINRHHLRKTGEKLARVFVTLNVAFWSAMVTVLSFILTTGNDFAHFFPFFGQHWAQIIGISTVLYNVAKPSLQWWKERQQGKRFVNRMPELTPLVEAVTTPLSPATASGKPSSSFVTTASGNDNLLQL